MTDVTFRLGLYESKDVIPVGTFAPGTHVFYMQIDGNSLLSSMFLKSCPIGATAEIKYYDWGPGDGSLPGERYDLKSHSILTNAEAPTTERIVVTRVHNRPRVELIVTGSPVEVGLYITVVADFPAEVKGPILNGQTANLPQDGGLPVSVYDPSNGKFYLLQGSAGIITTGSPLTTGKIEHALIAAPNVEQSHSFVPGTRQFMLKGRTGGKLLLAYSSGTSGSVGLTIPSGSVYESPQFAPALSKTIYFQSPVAGLVVEIESWS